MAEEVAEERDAHGGAPRTRLNLSWRERLRDWVESFDLTPRQLLVGLVLTAVAAVGGWHLLAPEPLPPEMTLPVASAPGGGETSVPGPSVPGATSSSTAPEDEEEVVVHVAGAVRRPGVVQLAEGARLADAVAAAGGAADDADLAQVNLAALAEDGQQVYVPRPGEALPTPPAGSADRGVTGGSGEGAGAGAGTELVNINTAGLDELEELPGIGPVLAQAIVDHREQEGQFTSVEQLLDVRGIGEVRFEDLRELVAV